MSRCWEDERLTSSSRHHDEASPVVLNKSAHFDVLVEDSVLLCFSSKSIESQNVTLRIKSESFVFLVYLL